jgi:hypothetical protein
MGRMLIGVESVSRQLLSREIERKDTPVATEHTIHHDWNNSLTPA